MAAEPALSPSNVVVADGATLMDVIARAAADPTTDVDKLERLMAMHERFTERQARAAYDEAMARMQPELPVIRERGAIKDNKDKVQSTYAKWEDVNAQIGPVLTKHGFSLTFRVGSGAEGRPTVTGVLAHSAGHREETTMTLPVDASGSKNNVQGVGSSTSYGKRYTTFALLNLVSAKSEDDDGQAAGQAPAVAAAITAIEACEGVEELRGWKGKNLAGLDALPQVQKAQIISFYNARLRKVRDGAS